MAIVVALVVVGVVVVEVVVEVVKVVVDDNNCKYSIEASNTYSTKRCDVFTYRDSFHNSQCLLPI